MTLIKTRKIIYQNIFIIVNICFSVWIKNPKFKFIKFSSFENKYKQFN